MTLRLAVLTNVSENFKRVALWFSATWTSGGLSELWYHRTNADAEQTSSFLSGPHWVFSWRLSAHFQRAATTKDFLATEKQLWVKRSIANSSKLYTRLSHVEKQPTLRSDMKHKCRIFSERILLFWFFGSKILGCISVELAKNAAPPPSTCEAYCSLRVDHSNWCLGRFRAMENPTSLRPRL